MCECWHSHSEARGRCRVSLLSFTFFFKTGSLTEPRALVSLSKSLARSTCLHLSILVHSRLLYERWDLNSCPLAFTTSTLNPLSHLFRLAVLISCTHFKPVIEKMNCEKLMGVFASLRTVAMGNYNFFIKKIKVLMKTRRRTVCSFLKRKSNLRYITGSGNQFVDWDVLAFLEGETRGRNERHSTSRSVKETLAWGLEIETSRKK